ncbi:MAG: glyoxalase [Lachnospiraceae bacterium]|nr:glyoxalase [Lachnospiraceae bacterium]
MFDDKVVSCFLDNQLQLFPEEVASTMEEAREFLEDSEAYVVDGIEGVVEYFEEAGIDIEEDSEEELLEEAEVFDIGDGRYLIVEA